MMKRIIVIYGNLACGKSTVIEELQMLLPKLFHKVSADDERWKIFRGNPALSGLKREELVRQELIRKFDRFDYILFETSLSGKYDRQLLKNHTRRSNRIWYFYLQVSRPEAMQRYYERRKTGYLMPPWPYRNQDVMSSIEHMHHAHRSTPKDATFDTEQLSAEDIALKIADICLNDLKNPE